MTQEIELKLELDPHDLALVRETPRLADAKSRFNHQVTVYYDTPETRLKKHGYTLRVRSVGDRFIQTVKRVTQSVGLISREEIEREVRSLRPDLEPLSDHPISELFRAGEARRLQEIVRCDVNRTSWLIGRHKCEMEIDLDHGTISAGERTEEFAELEFELRSGQPATLIAAARDLANRVPVRLGILTKAERGFLLANGKLRKIAKAVPVHVDPDMTVAQAFEVIVHACIKQYRLNEPLVLRKRKAGALHQARVGVRRLRSAMSLFKPAIEDRKYQRLRHELRWLASQFGDARNLDVYLEGNFADDQRVDLLCEREKAYDRVAEAMNSQRSRRLMIELVGWTAVGEWRSAKAADKPIQPFARRRLARLWDSITTASRDLRRMDEFTRHKLRIKTKKLRYASEFLSDLYPRQQLTQRKFAVAIEGLQESLGKLNDLATARMLDAAAADDQWLIGLSGDRRHLRAAEDALDDLHNTGPFWCARELLEDA